MRQIAPRSHGIAAWRRQLPRLSELPYSLVTVLSIFLFGLNYALIYLSETRVDSGIVAVLFGTLPFFSFAFARSMLGERTAPRVWVGASVALGGLAVIYVTGNLSAVPLYALAAVAAAASSSFANVYAKLHPSPPLFSLPPSMLLAGSATLLIGLVAERANWNQALAFSSVLSLLYLAVCGSALTFFLLLWLLNRLPAGSVGLATLTYPVVAILVGALFGGEHVTAKEMIGTLLVIAGLGIAYGFGNGQKAKSAKSLGTMTPVFRNSNN